MKPLSVRWIKSAYNYIWSESGIVCGGFLEAGIVDTVDQDEADSEEHSDDDPLKILTIKLTLFPITLYMHL